MSPLPAGARWSDAATALFDAAGETAVSAGAGSGKTTALVEFLLRRLAGTGPGEPLAPGEVVAITFTERAGAELLDRLGRELVHAAGELRQRGDAVAAERLDRALRELSGMQVGTIHGHAASLLRSHALEAGIDPDFAVLDEEQAGDHLWTAALEGAVALLDRGDEGGRRLAAALGGVRPLAEAVVQLARERSTRGATGPVGGVPGDPEAFERARGAVLEAARELAGLAASPTTETGQRALSTLAERAAVVLGAARLEEPWAEAERLAPLGTALKGWRAGKRDPAGLGEARRRFEEALGRLPLVAAELAAAPLAEALAVLLADVEGRYAAAKAAAGALDFDDLLVRARDLLQDAPAVRDEVRSRLRALLVDEYQDVNGLQAELFDLLAPPGGGGEGAPAASPLRVAVGDAKQSIYRFRGADVGVFAGLVRRLQAGGGQVLHLRENHRSGEGIVALVNAILDADPGALGVPFGPEDRLEGTRKGGAVPAAELLEGTGAGGSEERVLAEAAALAARAAELVAGGRPAGEIAVLLRRLTHAGRFERAFRQAGLPVRVARGGGFFQAPEVRDLGELCASLEEPGDAIAWASLLRSPLCALSDGSVVALARLGLDRLPRTDPALAGALLEEARGDAVPEGEEARLGRFLATWRELREARGRLDVGELLERAVRRLDLEAVLLAGPDGERRAGNLRKVLALARREAARGSSPSDLAARLRRMALRPAREPEADDGEGEAIAILSVHQAKGLEWPVVMIPELSARSPSARKVPVLDERGRVAVPHVPEGPGSSVETTTTARLRAAAGAAEAAESRRLLYVALTRARDQLVLSGAEGRTTGTWADAVSAAPPGLLTRRPATAPARAASIPRDAGVAGGEEVSPPELRPVPGPGPVRIPVTALAEYFRCPRRHGFLTRMRLPEPRPGAEGGDDLERATARGTLAHALLAEVDLAAPPLERRALLAAAASRRGEDLRRPGVREILEEVERYLVSPAGDELARAARAGRLRRELPFLLRLPGEPPCLLDGVVDALDTGDEGAAQPVRVVDYKYARYRPGDEERYRTQLAGYVLAVARAFPGRAIRAELHFLRSLTVVDVTPGEESIAALAMAAPALALGAVRGEGRDRSPAALGRDEARCRAEGCGFTGRCFGAPPPAPP